MADSAGWIRAWPGCPEAAVLRHHLDHLWEVWELSGPPFDGRGWKMCIFLGKALRYFFLPPKFGWHFLKMTMIIFEWRLSLVGYGFVPWSVYLKTIIWPGLPVCFFWGPRRQPYSARASYEPKSSSAAAPWGSLNKGWCWWRCELEWGLLWIWMEAAWYQDMGVSKNKGTPKSMV